MIARSAFLNLAGRGIPLLVALFVIPLLIKGLGMERYGLLTLVWVIIGYLGLLDIGIGRATTKFVADRLAIDERKDLPALIWTSWALLLGLGLLAGLLLAALVPVLVKHLLHVPAYLHEEATASLYWLALSMPFVLSTAGMQGTLEAQQRFDIINGIQIPASIIGQVAPLLILFYTQDLAIIMIALLTARVSVWGMFLIFCLRTLPSLRRCPILPSPYLKDLLQFGGWLTVSNVISPLMVHMDRFLIGAMLTLSAVTYYAAPYTMATQLGIIPASLTPVLFPAFSSLITQRSAAFASLYRRAVKYLFLAMLPFTIALIVLADDVMTLWLGAEFAVHGRPVLTMLAVGVLINSLAQVPYALIQASARPDITAKFHLLEVLPYFALLWWAIASYGIIGAAITWVARMTVDAVLLFWFADRLLPQEERGLAFAVVLLPIAVGLYGITVWATGLMADAATRSITVFGIMGLAAASVWRLWLGPEGKAAFGYCRLRGWHQRL